MTVIRRLFFWMLVIVFPFLGLIAGIWVKPENSPRWEKKHEHNIHILGYVDSGSTVLVLESKYDQQVELVGVSADTGQECYRQKLTEESLGARVNYVSVSSLSDDGKYVLFLAGSHIETNREVLLFDWKNCNVMKRIHVQLGGVIHQLRLRENKLVALASTNIGVWNLALPELPPYRLRSEAIVDVNDDLTLVFGVEVKDNEEVRKMEMCFKQLPYGEDIPAIPLASVGWLLDFQVKNSASLLEMDPTTQTYLIRQYRWKHDRYAHLAEKDRPLGSYGHPTIDHDTVYIDEALWMQPWRIKVAKWLGHDLVQFIYRFGSKDNVVHLYERKTMKYLHTLSLPASHKPVFEGYKLFRDPLGRGLAMCDGKTIEFWDFRPLTRFLPMSGLVLGTLFSALLIFLRFRKKLVPHNSAAH